MNRFSLFFVVLLALGQSVISHAHSGMTLSVPAGGASVAESPEQLVLSFSGDVRLVSLRVTGAGNEQVKLGQSRSLTPAQRFSLPLPALQPGAYTVHWMVMGSDSHKMDGAFTFFVKGQGAISNTP